MPPTKSPTKSPAKRLTVTKAKLPDTVPEWRLQAAACKRLWQMQQSGLDFEYAGDMNAARRTIREAGIATATGMRAGEPDLRVYLPGGRVRFIEMKRTKGTLTDTQKKRFPILKALGYEIIIVQVADEEAAAEAVERLVRAWLGVAGHVVALPSVALVAHPVGAAANDNTQARKVA